MKMFRVGYYKPSCRLAKYKAIVLAENENDAKEKFIARMSALKEDGWFVRVIPTGTDVYVL